VALSKREKYIAIGVASAVGIFAADKFALSPYFDALADVEARQTDMNQKKSDADDIYAKQKRLQKIWNDLVAGGLKSDRSAAETQGYNAMQTWSQWAGATFPTRGADQRTVTHGKFQVINFHIAGQGVNQRSLAQFLWAVESASVPMRVTDVSITPQPAGMDSLNVKVGLSTLCLSSDADRPKAATATPAAPTGVD
jgi:hypothetical protein